MTSEILWSSPQPYPQFQFLQFWLPVPTAILKHTILLPPPQTLTSSLTLHRNADVIYITASRHVGILSSRIIPRKRGVNEVQ